MKNKLLIVFIFFQFCAFANMANPMLEGTLGTRPYLALNVDVIHEDLNITLDKDFEIARFEIAYHIKALDSGIAIPFLFYASDYLDEFEVLLDGKPVEVFDIPYSQDIQLGSKFNSFAYFFDDQHSSEPRFDLDMSSNGSYHLSLGDMLYFESDISIGEHIISVSYNASVWIDRSDWVKTHSFRYALSPAKYWRSFGTLDVNLNARANNMELTSNLGPPTSGEIDSIARWHFDELPTEVLEIIHKPKISSTAETLINIEPRGIAIIVGIILVIIHLIWVVWYRKRHPESRYSVAVIFGSIVAPLFFLFSWLYAYDFIDYHIGENAARFHGYTFFVILLYPFILPVYWVIIWGIHRSIKVPSEKK